MNRVNPFNRDRRRSRQQTTTTPSSTSEADRAATLLNRSGRGDQTAFAELYDLLAPTVFGIVRRVLRDPSQAEEVSQEVFIELWAIAPRYDESKGSPRAWMATIAHRRAVDRVRSEQAHRDRDDRHANRNHERNVDHVSEEIITSLDHERVNNALARLTASQREAVTLAYYQGNTYRQVASLLDIPEGTAKTRIRDALIRLRDLLEVTQ
ncbi:MAG: ECF RNA polymerase sigma factor SigK [Acidimicrobiales bacterium]|nr:ECF RNA polymerase sigma factor SigK [Acidimicrobiales bacterium]